MSKLKRMSLAAAALLVAGTAMASNFRAADQVYVPAAGHLTAGSVTFVTDVFIANQSDDTITVSVLYTSGLEGTSQETTSFTLAPRERREFLDYLAVPKASGGLGISAGFGQLIFNGCRQGQDCGVASQDPNTGISPHFRNITVQTRTYSVPVGTTGTTPSNGQLFSGIPWFNYVSETQAANKLETVSLQGIRATSEYRTNIGFANASQFSRTTIELTLYRGNAPSTVLATREVTLGPLGVNSPTNVTSLFGAAASGTNLFVRARQKNSTAISTDPNVVPASCQPSGCPGFFVYGSVLDNATTDATTLEPMYDVGLTDIQIGCVYSNGTTPCKGAVTVKRVNRRR